MQDEEEDVVRKKETYFGIIKMVFDTAEKFVVIGVVVAFENYCILHTHWV